MGRGFESCQGRSASIIRRPDPFSPPIPIPIQYWYIMMCYGYMNRENIVIKNGWHSCNLKRWSCRPQNRELHAQSSRTTGSRILKWDQISRLVVNFHSAIPLTRRQLMSRQIDHCLRWHRALRWGEFSMLIESVRFGLADYTVGSGATLSLRRIARQ